MTLFLGELLWRKTVGVIGAGRIGATVIQRARAFGMKVVVADPYMTEERARDMYVELMELDDMLPVVRAFGAERGSNVQCNTPLMWPAIPWWVVFRLTSYTPSTHRS